MSQMSRLFAKLYGCETWQMDKNSRETFFSFGNRVLEKIDMKIKTGKNKKCANKRNDEGRTYDDDNKSS